MRLVNHDDNPDFLVECGGRTIGIEHTELFKRQTRSSERPYTPAELEGIQQKILHETKKLYIAQGGPPIVVTVWFIPGMRRTKPARGRSEGIAVELAQFITEWIRTPHSPDEWPRPGDRIPEISHLSIYEGQSAWMKGNPAWVGPPSVSDIQKTIDEKDAKYDVYRHRCDECWLLIAANRYNPAQGFDFSRDDSSLRYGYRSRFERLFFLELGDRWLRELSRGTPDNATKPIE
ncbi:MAG TPA: hypothetical protein VLI39_10880 [Sedimentisphaerales bacterium]|nr:hypothetical protein [Sedimentisphaerales bacterium]